MHCSRKDRIGEERRGEERRGEERRGEERRGRAWFRTWIWKFWVLIGEVEGGVWLLC
jgi:hypothetical protein